jgi:hypothetical protein
MLNEKETLQPRDIISIITFILNMLLIVSGHLLNNNSLIEIGSILLIVVWPIMNVILYMGGGNRYGKKQF